MARAPFGISPRLDRSRNVTSGSPRVKALRIVALVLLVVAIVRIVGGPMVAKIVVSKSKGLLTAYGGDGRVLKVVPAIVGRQPSGTKEREGDGRTPEGEYVVCFKNPQSRFHLSLGINYPNAEDAERGLAAGAITRAEYDEILGAHASGRIPPWKTALGGEIFIHGAMGERSATAGCVAVSDHAIDELFPQISLGTPVVIEP
jgi:murein L,D-transpeptidase YafK